MPLAPVDGRNRLRACEIAGIKPRLKSSDVRARVVFQKLKDRAFQPHAFHKPVPSIITPASWRWPFATTKQFT
jgi:hypothetical protein